MKIAFCCIVKGDYQEAKVLNNLLASVRPYVDAIYVTITQKNKKVEEVANLYNAHISHFEWCKDYSKARNFNFSQVPKEYDYIMWGDADDEFSGLDKLKEVMESHKADGYVMDYHYDHDKYGLATVIHPKTQIVSNDDTFEWKGKIHEDLDANREISLMKIEGIYRIHRTNAKRVKESARRNLEISLENVTGDPRDYWNLANAYTGIGDSKKSIETFKVFLEKSKSDMERYTAMLRIATMYLSLGDTIQAEDYARMAIGVYFNYPDAYHLLAQIQKEQGNKHEAINTALEGLSKNPPVDTAIVYNPRDYDYNPLMLLANLYWDTAQYEKSRTCLEACQEIQPKNKALESMIREADSQRALQENVKAMVTKMKDMTDSEFMSAYNALSEEEQQHPLMLQTKNMRFVKTESSGKDIVYFCGQTLPWNPESAKKNGIGGSEEAVINLTREWAKQGYNVTVYNDCGEEKTYDGVVYKPWYTFNYRDKQDVLIVWRQTKLLDYDLNASKIFIDIHDVMKAGEFTKKRLEKIDKVFLKSQAHRELFPNIPDDKVVIVCNGIDISLFNAKIERNPYLIINTSSPDRALSAIVRIFPKIKEKEPRAQMKWAYGFEVFDTLYKRDKDKQKWKNNLLSQMQEQGIENLDKLSHEEIAKLTLSAGVMLYPTHFMEIDCVSARKAQLGGAHVVCSDFGALKTTVQYGYKVPSPYTKDNWCPPYAFDFADDPERDDEHVNYVLEAFKNNERQDMQEWARTFTPEYVAHVWQKEF